MRAAQNKDSATASPVPVYKLGTRARSSRGLTCEFCKQLWRTRNLRYKDRWNDGDDRSSELEEPGNSEAPEAVQDEYDTLWVCPYLECDRTSLSNRDRETISQCSAGIDFLVIQIMPRDIKIERASAMVDSWIGDSDFMILQDLSTTQKLPYQPRKISSRFDGTLTSKWLQACKTHHAASSCVLASPVVVDITLIDCRTRELRESKTSEIYTALSYVWGTLENQSTSTGSKLPSDVPAVIMDAMAVTEALGLRYLWVDRYCIDQRDEAAKNRQISQMSTIYQQAELTIVAASGACASHGLPGVGHRPRKSTPYFENDRYHSMKMDGPNVNVPELSAWNTRAWTLQEVWMSRRILSFTDYQCYWECRGACISEGLDQHEQIWKEPLSSNSQESLTTGPRQRKRYANWNTGNERLARYIYQTQGAIERFTARELSLDSDALVAIEGVLSEAHSDLYSQEESLDELRPQVLLGLPIFLGISDEDPVRHTSLIATPSWHHVPIPRASEWLWTANRTWPLRRVGFPSWTWAGWKGSSKFDRCWAGTSREWGVDFCVKDLKLCREGTSTALVDTSGIHSTSDDVRLVFRAPEIPAAWITFLEESLRYDEGQDAQFRCVLRNRGVRFFPSEPDQHPWKLLQGLQEGGCRLVLVGFIKNRQVLIWLLRQEGDTFIRSGVITGFSEEGHSSLINMPNLNIMDCDDASAKDLSEALEGLDNMVEWTIS